MNLRKDHFNNNNKNTIFTPRFTFFTVGPELTSAGSLGTFFGFRIALLLRDFAVFEEGFKSPLIEGCSFRLFPLFFSHQPVDLDTNVTSAKRIKQNTPFNDGPLGSRNDEERGKMRKCSMNCRIYWIIDSLNAHCAELTQLIWHARLSLSSLTQHVIQITVSNGRFLYISKIDWMCRKTRTHKLVLTSVGRVSKG